MGTQSTTSTCPIWAAEFESPLTKKSRNGSKYGFGVSDAHVDLSTVHPKRDPDYMRMPVQWTALPDLRSSYGGLVDYEPIRFQERWKSHARRLKIALSTVSVWATQRREQEDVFNIRIYALSDEAFP